MKPSIQSSGHDGLELTKTERLAVNSMCGAMLDAWLADGRPFDVAILLMIMNAGAAKAKKALREGNK